MYERHVKILEYVSQKKKVDVTSLSEVCGVSQVTIRKDLIELENSGLLKRVHGYAVVNNEDNINYRLSIQYEKKIIIAKKAVELISDNEIIMIESGSTCALLALEIAKANKQNTIITNSLFIARFIKDYPDTKVIVLGGRFQQKSETVVGSGIVDSLKKYHVDKLFIGADGIDDTSITGSDDERCEAVNFMKEYATNVYVLADHRKFNVRSNFILLPTLDVKSIITDETM